MWMMLAAMQVTAPSPSPPQWTFDDDVRCMIVMSRLRRHVAKDAGVAGTQREALTAGMMYFLGRAEAQAPEADLVAAIGRAARAADTESCLRADVERCAQRMDDAARLLDSVSDSLR